MVNSSIDKFEAKLDCLPVELLLVVLGKLCVDDLVRTRSVCKALYRAAQTTSIWQNHLHDCLGSTIPLPFFLPRLLKDCSARDIEDALRRWEACPSSPGKQPGQVQRLAVHNPPAKRRLLVNTLVLLPGGQWVIGCCNDASVWCFDISRDVSSTILPVLLTPSRYSVSDIERSNPQISFAVDYTSREALGSGYTNHFLEQFNIALITAHPSSSVQHTMTYIDIWQIVNLPRAGWTGSSQRRLRPGTHLSSFMDEYTRTLGPSSLYGTAIAYNTIRQSTPCVAIVDWDKPNRASSKSHSILCHMLFRRVKTVQLLPGHRLFCTEVSAGAKLYADWRQFPQSTLRANAPVATVHPPDPVWKREDLSVILHHAVTPALVLRDSAHVILPTNREILALQVPIDTGLWEDCDVQSQLLVKDNLGTTTSRALQVCGYNKGLGIRDPGIQYLAQYHRTRAVERGDNRLGAGSLGGSVIDLDSVTEPCDLEKRLLFDQYSGHGILIDAHVKEVIFMHGNGHQSSNDHE